MGNPHVLVIPYPAQGHVIPLMALSHRLVDSGFKITFVNTEFNQKRVVAAMPNNGDEEGLIRLVSIPDGLGPGEDRNALGRLSDTMDGVTPGHLEELIRNINESNKADKITCVIADMIMGWALEVAEKMGIRRVAFWSASGVFLALRLHIPNLIEAGVINATNGVPTKNQMIQLSPTVPAMNTDHFPWFRMGGPATQQSIFNSTLRSNQAVKVANYLICNSFYELEPSVFTLIPNLQPIGPLFGSSRLAHFWPEDSTCLTWLDQQLARSVIYVAFGSLTVLDKRQFDELALGLELSGQPFLWVVRPDLINGRTTVYTDGFEIRVAGRGRMVAWAPQREVLAHPSIACFLTHCGWNSTMEALSLGVPFLCWPYFGDQLLNQSYICDTWEVGLRFDPDENGIISKEEIKKKVVGLLGDEGIRERALKLKEMATKSVSNGGSSFKNFEDFVQWMK